MLAAKRFNKTGFSRFLNSRAGRVFRLLAGASFLGVGLAMLPSVTAMILIGWSALPLSAGLLDVCWISAALGGPLTGRSIRADS